MSLRSIVISAATLIVACLSCSDRHSAVGSFIPLDNEALAYTDTIRFTLADLDTISQRQLYVAVTHSDSYPYRNLWLEVTYTDSTRTIRDTVGLTLADAYGLWLGHGIGNTYQMEAPLRAGVNPQAGSHVSIRHVMRVDTLRGITQVGVLAK